MKIINRKIPFTLEVKRLSDTINFLGVATKMKHCGFTILDDKTLHREHIINCLEQEIIIQYLKRFMECQTAEEVEYIKMLSRKGLFENQEVLINGKEAKILSWNESTKYYPMYVNKTSKNNWSKQKKLLYSNCIITGDRKSVV